MEDLTTVGGPMTMDRAPIEALSALGCALHEFDFRSCRLVAVRLEDWIEVQETPPAQPLRDSIAGRLVCGGAVFVVFGSESPPHTGADQSVVQRLTNRELKVASLIGDGLTDKEIARKLGISAHTVREHCRRACAKLSISKRSALVRRLYCARRLAGTPGAGF